MDKSKIIAGLEDLIEDRESFIEPDEPNSQFVYDKAILQAAVDLTLDDDYSYTTFSLHFKDVVCYLGNDKF